jgi:regulator of cell morphogenesis and NO signaling
MARITTATTLGDIVTASPSSARELERHGLDYCCGGRQTLEDACTAAGLVPQDVLGVLEASLAGETGEAEVAWATMDAAELCDHLVTTHHRYLWDELPRLSALVDKVFTVHGERHPELAEVKAYADELRADLEPHMLKEEHVLFPMVRELASATTAPRFHCGTLRNPISVMLREHDNVGELLRRLRELTADYTPPADACGSYQALYRTLEEIEADTHLHVHKENNVLFPAIERLEHRFDA